MPYSNVNYNLSYTEDVGGGGIGTITKNSSGKGGISQFYWSNGVRLTKFLSVGVKASYLFSSINKQNTNVLNINVGNYSSIITRDAFNGVNFSGGISFHKDSLFRKNYRLNIGATYSFSSNLNVQHKVTNELKSNSGNVIDSTTFLNESVSTTIPQNFGVGISFGKVDKWTIASDITFLDYGNYNSYKNTLTGQDHRYDDHSSPAFRSAIGGEFTPDAADFTSYLKRITYRTGVSYDQHQFLVNGNQLRDFGINFGLSLPVNRASTIDIGVKFGRRGAVSLNTIEENYFRLYFGVTFNDNLWFIKRKFD
jgi:long-subunit fatty acid transport protein